MSSVRTSSYLFNVPMSVRMLQAQRLIVGSSFINSAKEAFRFVENVMKYTLIRQNGNRQVSIYVEHYGQITINNIYCKQLKAPVNEITN
jgi:hypothetical protein